jgi:hypothetical protein
MPKFVWNEIDFIECLSVIPDVEDDAIAHHFVVSRNGLRLALSVYQYEAAVWISLYREESDQPLFRIVLEDSPGARLVRNRTGQDYIEFGASQIFGRSYDGEPMIPMGIRLAVDPDFNIQFF